MAVGGADICSYAVYYMPFAIYYMSRPEPLPPSFKKKQCNGVECRSPIENIQF